MSAEVLPLPKNQKRFQRLERSLYRYLPTKEIYVRKTFHKEALPDLSANTHEKTIGLARTAAGHLIAEHRAKYRAGIVHGRTIGDVIAEVIRTVTPTKRVGTQEQHRIYLAELSKELGHLSINDFTRATWATWLAGYRRRTARSTFIDFAKHLNLVLRYAHENRFTQHLVTIPNPDGRREKAGRVFTMEEIDRLRKAATTHATRTQFALCYGCAMRLREALYLTWDRVNLETGVITLRAENVKTGSATGKGRQFMVTQEALECLREQRRQVASRFVFPSKDGKKPIHQNKTAWRAMKRRAGITGRARWHDLRHSRISHLILIHKAPIGHVSVYVGTNIGTLQRVYLHGRAEDTAGIAALPTGL